MKFIIVIFFVIAFLYYCRFAYEREAKRIKVSTLRMWTLALSQSLGELQELRIDDCDSIVHAATEYRRIMFINGRFFFSIPEELRLSLIKASFFFKGWDEALFQNWEATDDLVILLGPDGSSLNFLRNLVGTQTISYEFESGQTNDISVDTLIEWFKWPDVINRLTECLHEAEGQFAATSP